MDMYDELDDLTYEDDVAARRAKAEAELDQIAQQVRQALTEQGIDTPLFFSHPNQTVGLDRVRCRPIACATTTDDMSQPTSADGATSR